jgi:hypothetical protein
MPDTGKEIDESLRGICERLEGYDYARSRRRFEQASAELSEWVRGAAPGREWDSTLELIFELWFLSARLGFKCAPAEPRHSRRDGMTVVEVHLFAARGGTGSAYPVAAFVSGEHEQQLRGAWADPLSIEQREEVGRHLDRWRIAAGNAEPADFKPSWRPDQSKMTKWLLFFITDAMLTWHLLRTSSPPAADETSGHYTSQQIQTMANVSGATINKYAKHAGVPTPDRGKRNHTYTTAQVRRILRAIVESTTSSQQRNDADAALRNLK